MQRENKFVKICPPKKVRVKIFAHDSTYEPSSRVASQRFGHFNIVYLSHTNCTKKLSTYRATIQAPIMLMFFDDHMTDKHKDDTGKVMDMKNMKCKDA